MSTLSKLKERLKQKETIIFLCIIVIGIFLRFYAIGTESLWRDEIFSIMESRMSIAGMVAQSNQPPVYFLLLNLWIRLFGTSEVTLRSLAAIFGTVSIILVYLTGSILFTRKVGLAGSFLFAISCFQIQYSQEVRGYSLLVLASLLSYYFFIKIIKQNKKQDYIFYLLANILLGYTHIFGVFIVISQILFFFIYWNKYSLQRIKFFAAIGAIILLYIPLAFMLFGNVQKIINNGFWITEPGFKDVVKTLVEFSGWKLSGHYVSIVFLIFVIYGFFSLKLSMNEWSWKSPLKSLENTELIVRFDSINEELLLTIWLSVSLVITFVISRITTPIFLNRYLIGASPALYLLVAKGIINLKKKFLIYPVLILIIVLSSFGLQKYYNDNIKEQWREVANFIEENSTDKDIIIFNFSSNKTIMDYYYKDKLPQFVFDEKDISTQTEIDKFMNDLATEGKRTWLVLWIYEEDSLFRSYVTGKYGQTSILMEKEFVGDITVILFDSTGK
jgi:mannosyltransferase